MKTLLLLRHAKAVAGESDFDDFDRRLAPRGLAAATQIGVWLAKNRLIPAIALVSSAQRAQQTWDRVAAALGANIGMQHERALYLATPGEILSALGKADDKAGCVIMVGHNPGFETLARMLAGPQSDAGAMGDLERGFPTAGLGVFALETDSWADIVTMPARLEAFVRPRDL